MAPIGLLDSKANTHKSTHGDKYKHLKHAIGTIVFHLTFDLKAFD